MDSNATRGMSAAELAALRRRRWPWWVTLWGQIITTKPLAALGLFILVFFLIVGVFSTWIAPEGINDTHPERLILAEAVTGGSAGTLIPGPSWAHPFGLDNLGRDLFSRIIHGARISMLVGVGTVVLGVGVGAVVGIISAWMGGRFDNAIQRFVDAWMTFPTLPVLITIVTLLPQKPLFDLSVAYWAMLKIILALGLLNIAWDSRIVRSAALVIKENQYVDAARAMGATGSRIVFKHILPNVMAPIITLGTLGIGGAILAEASLSFLGFGIPPPNPSWGGLLVTKGNLYFYGAPWIAFFPGLAITFVVLGINLLGDGLRDLLDPRLRGQT